MTKRKPRDESSVFKNSGFKNENNNTAEANPTGRFPANLLVCDDVLNDGVTHKSGKDVNHTTEFKSKGHFGMAEHVYNKETNYGDSGSFSRYYDLDKWYEKIGEYKYNNNNKDSLLKLNGLIGLGENDALKPMTIANGKIADISYGPSVTSINDRMLESPKSELAVPNRFINSALLLSTLKDNPSNSGITPTSKQMRGSAYSLAITAGRIYGTPEILDPQFVLNDKVTRDNSSYPIFNPLKSEFYQRVINGDMNTFEQLLEHMKTIDFRNNNGDSDISRETLNIEKEFLINLLEYTQRYFTRGAE